MVRILLVVLGLAIVWLLALAGRIVAFSRTSDPAPADAAIVLGAAVWGERPSPIFRERIRHAISLYRAGRVRALVFTGGKGQGKPLAEAEAARIYAIEHGVPAGAIFTETLSKTTYENLRQARPIVVNQGFRRVLLVSDPLHMQRAMAMAQGLGLPAYASPTPTTRYRSLRSRVKFLSREVIFYAGYLIGIYR
jgi:uncharacterized SAM-binding protein YcdF (DUF218 family)